MDENATLERLLAERDWLRRLAGALVRETAAAEDLTQDVWVRALERAPADVRRPRAWLGTVVRNLAASRGRSERRRTAKEQQVPRREMASSPPDVLARAELVERVGRLALALPEPYRATVLLTYFEGLPPRKVAARMGVPVETVRTRLKRARARLAADLDAGHQGDRRTWALPLLAWVESAPAVPAAGALLGAIAVKKMLAGTLLVVVLAFVGWQAGVFDRGERDHPAVRVGPASAPDGAEAPTLKGRSEPAPDDPAVERAELPQETPGSGGTWSGRVVGADGHGIAGATVELAWQAGAPGEPAGGIDLLLRRERERHDRPHTTTDAEGHFRIVRPVGGRGILVARSAGFSPGLSKSAEAGTPVEILLLSDAFLRVQVRGPRGDAVRGTEVRLVAPALVYAPVRRVLGRDRTAADGSARLPVPRTHGLRLEVDPADPALGLFEGPVRSGQTAIDVTVPQVKVIERRVVDAVTGDPVPDAYVLVLESFDMVSPMNEPVRRRFDADAAGIVRFPHQEGYFAQTATAPGYEVGDAWEDPIRLTPAMRITGVVLSSEGEPVPDIPIVLLQAGGGFDRLPTGLPLVAAYSDAAGRFTAHVKLPWPPRDPTPPDRGLRTVVALHAEWPAAVEDEVRVVPGGAADVTLRFGKPAVLDITIVDPRGEPVPNQWLGIGRVVPAAETWPPKLVGRWGMVDLKGLVGPWTHQTDAAGRLQVGNLAPGTWYVYSENARTQADLVSGQKAEVRLVMGGGLAIAGRVLDAAGVPAVDHQVGLSGPRAAVKRTDAEGRFRFADLAEGTYSVSVWWREGADHFGLGRSARPGDEVELRIPAGPARLRLDVEGPPPETVEYSLMTRCGGYAPRDVGTTPLEGEERLTQPFTPGAGLVVVRAQGWGWTVAPFDAPANATTDVALTLTRSGAVRAHVTKGHRGSGYMIRLVPIGDFPDRLFHDEDDPLRYAISRSVGSTDVYLYSFTDDRSELDDVPPGLYDATYGRWIHETRTWEAGETIRIEVRSDETTHLDI